VKPIIGMKKQQRVASGLCCTRPKLMTPARPAINQGQGGFGNELRRAIGATAIDEQHFVNSQFFNVLNCRMNAI
jgi:hypothetical protein